MKPVFVRTGIQDFCQRAEMRGEASPYRSLKASRVDLCYLFHALGYRFGVEVGVWKGNFSARIAAANPGVHLTCVDPWHMYEGYRERKNDAARLEAAYVEACGRLKRFNCEIWRLSSIDAAERIADRSLDFVYIDGNHAKEFVLADLAAWTPKIRSGGIIAGHDYGHEREKGHIEVKEAVDLYTRVHQIDPWFVLALEDSPTFFWEIR